MPSQEHKRRELLKDIAFKATTPAGVERLISEAGYVLVPREPTKAMVKAACKSLSPSYRPPGWLSTKDRAMIAAIEADNE